MRKLLAPESGGRKKFHGTFSRFGKKKNFKGYSEDTILIVNVVDQETGSIVTDHVWFNMTKGFEKLDLAPGLRIGFEARIKAYRKGYINRRYKIDNGQLDYKLSHPTQIITVEDPK